MLKNQLERKLTTITTGIFVFSFAFVFTFIFSAQFNPVYDGSAAEISVMNQVTGYYANLSSLGTLSLTLASSPEGTYATTKDTITVDTNTTTGYKLYISTVDHSSDSPALPSDAPSNGLIDSASGSYLSPSTGAADTPVRLAVNTWGYVPSRSTSSEASVEYTDADAAPTEAKGGKAVWRAVPEYGDEDIFYANSSPTTASTNSVDIYYAVNASTALPSGTYSNTVVYTAIVDGGTDETGDTEASISPVSQDGLDSGQEVTIATSLYPGLSLNNLGDITVKIGDNDCTNITPVLTEIGSLNLTCIAPAQTTTGKHTVIIDIPKYDKTYTLTDAYEYILPAFYTITKMQEMTHDICFDKNVIAPKADATGEITISNWQDVKDGSKIPTRTLLDDRAGQVSYTIKKLADGKCWMTENLALPPETTITAEDSDLDGVKVVSYTLPTSSSSFTNNPDDEQMNADYTTDTTDLGYRVGNYYSWRVATAGTGRGAISPDVAPEDIFGTDMNVSGNNTLVSICPKNWRLPTANNGDGTTGVTVAGSSINLVNGDNLQLYKAYGGVGTSGSAISVPEVVERVTGVEYGPNLAASGIFGGVSQSYFDEVAQAWSSTNLSNRYTRHAYFYNQQNKTAAPVDNGGSKYIGLNVRCVAR